MHFGCSGRGRFDRANPGDRPSHGRFTARSRHIITANPGWGAPRIHGELLKLGIHIGETSVSKYLVRNRKPPSQRWRTFLDNHLKSLVSETSTLFNDLLQRPLLCTRLLPAGYSFPASSSGTFLRSRRFLSGAFCGPPLSHRFGESFSTTTTDFLVGRSSVLLRLSIRPLGLVYRFHAGQQLLCRSQSFSVQVRK